MGGKVGHRRVFTLLLVGTSVSRILNYTVDNGCIGSSYVSIAELKENKIIFIGVNGEGISKVDENFFTYFRVIFQHK